MQEGPQPLGHGEHPLADGKVQNDLVGQVRDHLRHAAGVARRAHASSLAGERQEPIVPIV